MKRVHIIPILAISLTALGALSGCGGGSGDSAASATPTVKASKLDRKQYLRQVNAACAKRRDKLPREMVVFLGGIQQAKRFTLAKFGPLLRKVILPAYEDELAVIRSHGAPSGDEDEIEAILSAQEAALAKVRKMKRPRSLDQVGVHFAKVVETMEEYGFTACIER